MRLVANDNATDFDWQSEVDEDDEFRVDLIGEDDGGVTWFDPAEDRLFRSAA